MAVYPLVKQNKEGTLLKGTHSFYSESFAQDHCNLYLTDSLVEGNGENEHSHVRRYRLHAKNPHNIEMALAYDINCPHCGNRMKQVGRQLDFYELGVYACSRCDKK